MAQVILNPLSSLTVDVEEYFHAANLEICFPPRQWHALPSRVERSTLEVLDIFDEFGAKGTFFTLGTTARRHQALVREIVDRGHELASHGYGHRIVWTQTPRSFYRDVRKAKLLLEEISGSACLGYRAPNFSIIDRSLWAYDELAKAGYRYDSSLYPVPHPRYGNAHREIIAHNQETKYGSLTVLPLSVFQVPVLGRIGVAGGGWWRLLPAAFIQLGLRRAQKPLNCYLHPWELDPGQPRGEGISLLSRFRHYTGVSTFPETIRNYLRMYGSAPLRERLNDHR